MLYTETNKWKVLEPKRVVPHPMTSEGSPVSLVVLHHTVTAAGPFFDILRSVDAYHHTKVYNDIAYNGAASNVSPDFTDLRGPLVQGGATGKTSSGIVMDTRSLSIVVPGDFETAGKDEASTTVVETVSQLIRRWILAGYVTRDFVLAPHREYRSTACCGSRLIARIPEIRERVELDLIIDDALTGGSDMTEEERELLRRVARQLDNQQAINRRQGGYINGLQRRVTELEERLGSSE